MDGGWHAARSGQAFDEEQIRSREGTPGLGRGLSRRLSRVAGALRRAAAEIENALAQLQAQAEAARVGS